MIILVTLVLLLAYVLIYEQPQQNSFAFSPPFIRQEIIDQPPNDWVVGNNMNNTFSLTTTNGDELTVERAQHLKNCSTGQNGNFPSPDIEGVSYYSNGKTLNATVWLSSPFKEHIVNGTLWSASSFKELPWHQMGYTMSIDTLSVYDTGATDYFAEIKWDFMNETWSKIIYEGSKIGEKREIDGLYNYTDFFDDGRRYFVFSLDLAKINYPDQYKVIITAYDNFLNNDLFCYLYDSTNWVHIPPPEFVMTTKPTSTVLRPGETKNIELQVRSDSNLKSNVYLSTERTQGIELMFQPNYIFVPPKGIATSVISVKAQDNAKDSPYTLPLHARIYFITEGTLRGGEKIIGNPQVGSITESSNLAIEVLKPLSPQEHLNNFFTGWFTPLTAMYQATSAIIGGIVVWFIAYRRRKNGKMSRKQANSTKKEK
jgi:hypothetical protein